MDTLQIERILKNDSCAKKIFKGVYPKDQLPTVEYPGSYVVNTDPSTSPGEHWVAMFFNNQRSAEFFDSYGLHPIVYGLTDFLDSHASSWTYNSKTLQSLISEVCGHYTVYYILFRSRGCSLTEILTHFSDNVSVNDKTVERFVENLLKM